MKRLMLISFFAINCAHSVNAASSFNTELVINGGAETGNTSGWISSGIDAFSSAYYSSGFGAFVFAGGTGESSQSLQQTIDVSDNSAKIDVGEINSTFQVYLQSRADELNRIDSAGAGIYFLGDGGSTLGLRYFEDTLASGWNFFSYSQLLPTGTRSIQIILTSTYPTGIGATSADGLIDNVSLQLNDITAVPVPAAFWLFGSALASLGIIGKRRSIRTLA